MPRRPLTLVRETLADLAPADLAAVAAGAPETHYCPVTTKLEWLRRETDRWGVPTLAPDCL